MSKEMPVEMLWLRCGLWVMDWALVADMNAMFGREGILGSRIVHCSVERVVDMQGELFFTSWPGSREKVGAGGWWCLVLAGSEVGANVVSRWRCRERRDWDQLKSRKRRSVKKLKKGKTRWKKKGN
jgi:hypothetical protein